MPLSTPTVAPSVADFLADYPEFDTSAVTDPAALQFSPSALTYWQAMGGFLLNQPVLGNLYYLAYELFMAHNLALEAWSAQGGPQTVPGIAKGSIASASSPEASVSYMVAATLELDAGHWNYTTYGQRLIRLMRTLCAGPLYVGAGCGPGSLNGPGWAGPPFFNFPNPSG